MLKQKKTPNLTPNRQHTNNDDNTDDSTQKEHHEKEEEGHNEIWLHEHNTFKLIVDNKQLCDTITGIAHLPKDDKDYKTCNNIVDMLIKIKDIGYTPAPPTPRAHRMETKGQEQRSRSLVQRGHG